MYKIPPLQGGGRNFLLNDLSQYVKILALDSAVKGTRNKVQGLTHNL